MDVVLLSGVALSILSNFVKDHGVEMAEKAGEAAAEVAKQLFNTIKEHFKENDKKGEMTLDLYEEDPENLENALQKKLMAQLEQNQAFAQQLQKLIDDFEKKAEPEAAAQIVVKVKGSGAAAVDGAVAAGKGGYAAGRDMHINTKSEDNE